MLKTVDELFGAMQKHRHNACALYIRREIGESCVFIKRGCASLADNISIPKEKKENYRNVAFLYINFDEKSKLRGKPFIFLLFVQKIGIFDIWTLCEMQKIP